MDLIHKMVKSGYKVYDFRVYGRFNYANDIFFISNKWYMIIDNKLALIKNIAMLKDLKINCLSKIKGSK